MKVPHPFQYQGSKRNLAAAILKFVPDGVKTLIEPFAGSAAITLATSAAELAERFVINDLNGPLAKLWDDIINKTTALSAQYEELWNAQLDDMPGFYVKVRSRFNISPNSGDLLYLLARCVKGAVRYNGRGEINQSPDNRRKGTLPATMRNNLTACSKLLKGKTRCCGVDYAAVVKSAGPNDLVYMDPPYQGVCGERDARYFTGIKHDEFVEVLEDLNSRNVMYIVSYDGRTGTQSTA